MKRSRTALMMLLFAFAAGLGAVGVTQDGSGVAADVGHAGDSLRRPLPPEGYDFDFGLYPGCGWTGAAVSERANITRSDAAPHRGTQSLAALAADRRHSTGNAEVLRINREQEGGFEAEVVARQGVVLVFVLREESVADVQAAGSYSAYCSSRYGRKATDEYDYRYEDRFGGDYCHAWEWQPVRRPHAPAVEYAEDLVREDLAPKSYRTGDDDAHVRAYREHLASTLAQAENLLAASAKALRLGGFWLEQASQGMSELSRKLPTPEAARRAPSAPPARIGRNPWLDLDMGL